MPKPDLNEMKPAELAAAMKDGTEAWGRIGSYDRHIRYMVPLPPRRGRRRKCHCGCEQRITHAGMANGMALTSACELRIRRWVRDGK